MSLERKFSDGASDSLKLDLSRIVFVYTTILYEAEVFTMKKYMYDLV